MRIKRTYAATMREALALVKQEQGPDAVILGNKKVPGGVEILSAIDFDHHSADAYAGAPAAAVSKPLQAAQPAEPALQKSSLDLKTVPDFLLNQTAEPESNERREPVLGLIDAAPQPAAAPVAATPTLQETLPETAKPAAPTTASRHAAPARQAPRRPFEPAAPRNSHKSSPLSEFQQAEIQVRRKMLPVEQEVRRRAAESDALDSAGEVTEQRKSQFSHPVQHSGSNPMMDEVKDEIKNLRDLMQSQLSVLDWDRYSDLHPVRTVLLNLMTELGLGADICEMIFDQLGNMSEEPHKLWQQALGLLAKSIPIASSDILTHGGRIALVGSTGVGKTTTIAKLAARFAHSHGKRSVAMITTDNFRIGAQEQLQHFARMLEIPLLTANSSEELTDRLTMLADKQLVLIDTAGMSQSDVRLSEQFHKLQHGSPEIKPYLVLSANTQLAALNETIKSFNKVKLAGAIITKLDESASLGGIITTAIRHQLPLTYCGTGQRVPEDLQQAKTHRLVSKAVSLMQQYGEQVDKETMAFRYHHIISNH
jgi:flagellar biosynthesis protein FlhF